MTYQELQEKASAIIKEGRPVTDAEFSSFVEVLFHALWDAAPAAPGEESPGAHPDLTALEEAEQDMHRIWAQTLLVYLKEYRITPTYECVPTLVQRIKDEENVRASRLTNDLSDAIATVVKAAVQVPKNGGPE